MREYLEQFASLISNTPHNLLLYPYPFPSSRFKAQLYSLGFLLRPYYFYLSKMGLLKLPSELRLRIYDFCFPPPGTSVQVVPYIASSSSCHLKLPLNLYLVCKTIYTELPILKSKLRQLDFTFLVVLSPPIGGLKAEDNPLARTLRYAERLRVVGTEWLSQTFPPRMLFPGSDCAVKVVELQPANWSLPSVIKIIELCWPILSHRDVMGKLEIILIKEDSTIENDKTLDEIEGFLVKLYRKINSLDSQ